MSVVTKEVPTLLPILRMKLMIPATELFLSGGIPMQATKVIGTNRNPRPMTWVMRSHTAALKLICTRPDNPNFQNSVNGLTQQLAHSGLGTHVAHAQAYARTYQAVQTQAASLAYIDTFMVLAMGSAIMFFLAFMLKKNDPGGGPTIAE